MLKALLGIIGFSMNVTDPVAQRDAFVAKMTPKMGKKAAEGLAMLKGLDDEDRPNVTGKIGQASYFGRFEAKGKLVTPEVWCGMVVDELRPVGRQLSADLKPIADSWRAAHGKK